jgi:hypothetical protein
MDLGDHGELDREGTFRAALMNPLAGAYCTI